MCNGDAIVFENVSASVVEGSTIRSNIGSGIAITGSPAPSQADTVRSVVPTTGGGTEGGGVTITSGGDFSDFVISDNQFENTGYLSFCGITVSVSLISGFRRNTFSGPCGLEVMGNRNTIVSNVVDVTFGSVPAISVSGERNVIGENHVRAGMGIQVGGVSNTLRGNTVENGGTGIEEFGGSWIKGNTVQNNSGDGIRVWGSTRINGNHVLNNGKAGEWR